MVLIVYCFVASVTPVWILLQPRDYLSSFLLYASMLLGLVGILFGGFDVQFPGLHHLECGRLGPMFPDRVHHGGLRGVLRVPFAGGLGNLLQATRQGKRCADGGIRRDAGRGTGGRDRAGDRDDAGDRRPACEQAAADRVRHGHQSLCRRDWDSGEELGFSFGLLALSTFILTTLDTATRLGRYIFEEFFQLQPGPARYVATLATLALPTVFALDHADGRPGPADSRLEGDLARVRRHQPVAGGLDAGGVGRLAAADEAKDGLHLAAAGVHDGGHAVRPGVC